VEFCKRLLVIFLGLLEVPGERRKSRRTRDGRTPFVREQQLAEWFGAPHPVISRWYGYWLAQDWRRLLSQRHGEVLTLELQQRVIESWVQFPWWSAQRLWEHLRAQGHALTLAQVTQVGRESGWTTLRQALMREYQLGAESFRPREIAGPGGRIGAATGGSERSEHRTAGSVGRSGSIVQRTRSSARTRTASTAVDDASGAPPVGALGVGGGWHGAMHLLWLAARLAQEPHTAIQDVHR